MNKESLISKIREEVLDSMVGFMESYIEDGEEPPYTREDIDSCEEILTDYVSALALLPHPDDEKIMDAVKEAVLRLNELNEETDYCLIETEERENIALFIQECAELCGLNDIPEDVTEEWRDW